MDDKTDIELYVGSILYVEEIDVEEALTIKSTDYFYVLYKHNPEDNSIKMQISQRIPSSLNSTQKGKIGEEIARIVLNMYGTNCENLMQMQSPGSPFDILDWVNEIRYDVKFSKEHHPTENGATNWKFCLKGDRGEKNYEQDADYLYLVGVYDDPSKTPAFFKIPTNIEAVKTHSDILIPTSGNSIYQIFRIYPLGQEI
jgi:hypothetical protein